MTSPAKLPVRLGALALAALVASGCAVFQKPKRAPTHVDETRRAEEAVETAPPPSMPLPSVAPPSAPPPKRVTRVAQEWPSATETSRLARPMSELARTHGPTQGATQPVGTNGGGAGGRERAVVHAMEIPFAPGAPTLDTRARSLLDQLAARLNLNDAPYLIEVQGHADASGTDAANFAIGLQRAEEVRRYLMVAAALPASRIAVVSLGAGLPVADNATSAGRSANRRAVVLVLR